MMDYQAILQSHLLSTININLLVNMVLENFRISQKAVSKCENIIRKYLTSYLDKLERYPENNDELIEAIKFLNEKCFDDFSNYLFTKYPSLNLQKKIAQKEPDIIILTEDEKNELINKYKPNNGITDFLSYLTNPQVLQMFNMLITPKTTPIVIDQILDEAQVQQLLGCKKQISNVTNRDIVKPQTNTQSVEQDGQSDDNISDSESKTPPLNTISDEVIDDDVDSLTTNLTKDKLPLIEKKINELISLQQTYLSEKKMVLVNKVKKEKEQLINAVRSYKKDLEKEALENENKINNIKMTTSKQGDNVEHLNLNLDPCQDHNNLKDIVIKCKADTKITEIMLVDYHLPFNSNNVTRFNNNFMVYFNDRVCKITIPPAKYEIQELLDFIKGEANFLDFSINENNIITISNNMAIKFDLMMEQDSIFPLLGFNGNSYKDCLSYSGNVEYDMKSNEKVFFCLSGTTMEPILMELDKETTVNKCLKKSRFGINMKQFTLRFNNTSGQYYDFLKPFRICFKITYVNK